MSKRLTQNHTTLWNHTTANKRKFVRFLLEWKHAVHPLPIGVFLPPQAGTQLEWNMHLHPERQWDVCYTYSISFFYCAFISWICAWDALKQLQIWTDGCEKCEMLSWHVPKIESLKYPEIKCPSGYCLLPAPLLFVPSCLVSSGEFEILLLQVKK